MGHQAGYDVSHYETPELWMGVVISKSPPALLT